MKEYLVIAVTEDGVRVEWLSKKELTFNLAERSYGDIKWVIKHSLETTSRFDVMSSGGYGLIVKGKVITPMPKQVVTEYEVE